MEWVGDGVLMGRLSRYWDGGGDWVVGFVGKGSGGRTLWLKGGREHRTGGGGFLLYDSNPNMIGLRKLRGIRTGI